MVLACLPHARYYDLVLLVLISFLPRLSSSEFLRINYVQELDISRNKSSASF